MKKPIAIFLVLIGACIMVFGGYRAISALGGLYESNLKDPMNQPDGAEKATSDQMLHGAMIGAIGVPIFLVGYITWKVGARRSRLKP